MVTTSSARGPDFSRRLSKRTRSPAILASGKVPLIRSESISKPRMVCLLPHWPSSSSNFDRFKDFGPNSPRVIDSQAKVFACWSTLLLISKSKPSST